MTKINDYNSFVKCALIWIFNEYQMYVERLLTLYTRVQSNTFQGISSFLTFDQTCTDFNKETEFSQVTFVRVPKHHEMFSNLMDIHCTLRGILWHKKPLCKILIMFSKSKLHVQQSTTCDTRYRRAERYGLVLRYLESDSATLNWSVQPTCELKCTRNAL